MRPRIWHGHMNFAAVKRSSASALHESSNNSPTCARLTFSSPGRWAAFWCLFLPSVFGMAAPRFLNFTHTVLMPYPCVVVSSGTFLLLFVVCPFAARGEWTNDELLNQEIPCCRRQSCVLRCEEVELGV